ncbi:MAG: lysylphosphatidylglycerol synthase transmembrane domain-containing protein [Acidobacteriota bacterium]|nr:flippase-like domain-containing protein [Blastocatellia bacterium]MDW8239671.1 lysylphosphatidylglycerol synthase transmembrane domain-containing protein [Acidobacteriota bacterium]
MNKWLWLGLKMVVSAALLFVVLRRVEAAQLRAILHQAHVGYLAIAVGLYCLGQLMCAYRWKILMQPVGLNLSYGQAASLYFLGMFFNLFFPTMVGGDVVKVYYVTREGSDVPRATASVLMDRISGLCALLLLAVVVAGVADVRFLQTPLLPPLLGIFLLFGAATFTLFHEPAYRWLASLFERWRVRRLVNLTEQFHQAFASYRQSVAPVIFAVVLSLVFDVALISFAYVAAAAIGWPVAFKYFCVFIPLIALIGMIPITVYGFGLREYSFVFFFSQVGMSQEASLLLAFLFFFIVVVASLPGAIIYVVYRTSGAALPIPKTPHTEPSNHCLPATPMYDNIASHQQERS